MARRQIHVSMDIDSASQQWNHDAVFEERIESTSHQWDSNSVFAVPGRKIYAASTVAVAVVGTDHPELRSWVRWGLAQAGTTRRGRRPVGGRHFGSELLSCVTLECKQHTTEDQE